MSKPAGEIGHLRDEELPAVRVIVPPDLSGRVFEDDLDPGDVVFDGNRTRDAHLARALPARPRVAIRLGAELRHRRQGEPGRLHRRPQPGRRRRRRGAGPRLLAIRGLSRPRLAAVITAAAIWSRVPAGPATRPQPALARRLRAPGRPCADDTTSDPCWQRPDLTWEHGLGLSSDARCARCAWRASSASRAGWGIG